MQIHYFDEMYNYRIRHWTMEMGNTQEYLFDEQTKEYMLCPRDQEKPKSPIARCGLPVMTIHYIKLCSILEPMSLLMGYAKANVSQQPWEILRTAAFQHHTSQRAKVADILIQAN